MFTSNRWRYFLLVFIYKAAETSQIKVSDSTQQGFNINNDYELDYPVQDNERAFQINEDYLHNSRRITTISPVDKKYNCHQCGIANQKRSRRRIKMNTTEPTRIRGGKEVNPPRKYPWHVGISQDDNNFGIFFCGGSIINDQWILTAAHCFKDSYYSEEENCIPYVPDYVKDKTKQMKVRVGDHKQGKKWDDDENTKDYEFDFEDIKFHPKNKNICPPFELYDFALLKLKNKITFNSVIKPVCLPEESEDGNESYAGEKGIVTGWGTTITDVWSDVLKEFQYRIKGHKKCERSWPELYMRRLHICAAKHHKGPCDGDSGGPFVVKKGGRYFQVGVVSFTSFNCGQGPDVYGRLSNPNVLRWIRQITDNGKC